LALLVIITRQFEGADILRRGVWANRSSQPEQDSDQQNGENPCGYQ
jgi:hypothetical protein